MSESIDDLQAANLYLFNMLFRHQVYLEGLKLNYANTYKSLLNDLYGEFAKFIGQTRYTTMDAMTRIELERFIRRFTAAQHTFYSRYTTQLSELLQQFLAVDRDVLTNVYESATGLTTTQRYRARTSDDLPPVFGLRATHNTPVSIQRLWGEASTTIIPANGLTLPELLHNFKQTTTDAIVREIRKSYANADTPQALLTSIVGNPDERYRDGLFSRFSNQNAAILATGLQHVTTLNNASIASVHFNQYQWVSVMDSKTTPICIERNGNVYTYGEGPLPPAHWFCRSKDVPTFGSELHDIPQSFGDWLVTQPHNILDDMLGSALASQIMGSTVALQGLSINALVIPLTLTQFHSKIDTIVE